MKWKHKARLFNSLIRIVPAPLGRFAALLVLATLPSFFWGPPLVQASARLVSVGVYENAPKVFTSESGKPS
ncbi:MAG TPA: hypothetical protein VF903_04915, partial [Nitrospirota bacterium]